MPRRSLPVDSRGLLAALTARDGGLLATYLDLVDGSLLTIVDGAAANESVEAKLDADPDRYARVPLYRREYRLMTEFVETVDDDDLARRLDTALTGPGAFRGFDATLGEAAGETARWQTYRTEALTAWAATWLRTLGLEPKWDLPTPPDRAPEIPSLLRLTMLGESTAPATRRAVLADEATAQRLFLRLARDLCELNREPFLAQLVRGRKRFRRGAVELECIGDSVVVRLVSAQDPEPGA